ncbi:hypothetical protein CC78DRAFT_577931 [Lojkania enalia]|uniref:Glycoside hydrolase family 92 protein n=1 Tax=Lojkania enalia TaxID=147567 RepID=A0A9P4N8U5_9PLEO|nr:hypothetical protein CC78DRAFT_577931 [Didymosphaeria enalia]
MVALSIFGVFLSTAYGANPSFARRFTERADALDVLDWIDPLIGSRNGGNVFSGATLPYGMAKAVADVDGENTGGFSTDGSRITGFSALHDSGTGGNPSLGNFPIFPQLCPEDDLNNCKYPITNRAVHYKDDSIKAEPGYFGVTLENGIKADMTVSEHVALFRFDFSGGIVTGNDTSLSPLIQLDLTDLWASRQNASITVEASEGSNSGQIRGNGTFLPSFGAGSYVLYFCLDISGGKVKDSGVWVNNRAGTEPKQLHVTRGFNLFYLQAGGFIRFQAPLNGPIYARMGLSFISTDKACSNAETEIPTPESQFDDMVANAKNAWRQKLAPITIEPGGVNDSMQISFWSGIYRTMISPQDYTGENPHWESNEPYFDSFYCIWDMWRVQLPFLTIVDPIIQSKLVRSLLDTYKHRGWLPDCMMSTCKGWTQGGSDADNVLADAYVKNLSGIDWELAYQAMVNDAENEPLEWSIQGRGGSASWKRLNYIPYLDFDPYGFGTNSRSISRTLEYSYNDFCLATLAKGLGKDTYTKYISRAGNWQNLFKADQKSTINGIDSGFTGFFQPKYLNGTWGYQDPIACSPLAGWCSLTSNPSETFESSCWEYMFFVPHDIHKVIELLGGPETFLRRLDFFHTSGLADIGNEPVFLTVYMPHYAGRPGLSSKRAHSYIPSRFNSTHPGLPGNDDSGAMASFTIFANIGLFPNPGQNVYFIIPPFFESVSIISPLTNKTATIRNLNFDNEYKRIYIQQAKLNGETYTKNWVGHEFFTEGWTLELTLGEEESEWGTKEEDLPPSLSTGSIEVGLLSPSKLEPNAPMQTTQTSLAKHRQLIFRHPAAPLQLHNPIVLRTLSSEKMPPPRLLSPILRSRTKFPAQYLRTIPPIRHASTEPGTPTVPWKTPHSITSWPPEPLIPPPKEGEILLERRPNRDLPPYVPKRPLSNPMSPAKTNYQLTQPSSVPPFIPKDVQRTFPIFVLVMGISVFAFFNYQKQESSVVTSTLYALRTNPLVREELGDEIYFASKYPWIRGEINQVHGRINISFWVKGTRRQGKVVLRCRRRGRGGYFVTQEWSLELEDGRVLQLYDPDGNAVDPFQDPLGE